MADIVEKMINQQPDYVVYNDEVLMALARTFPSGIDNLEAFFCPSFEDMREKILGRTKASFVVLLKTLSFLKEDIISPLFRCSFTWRDLLVGIFLLLMLVPLVTIVWMFHLIRLPLLMAYFCLYMLYYLSWKTATIIVPHIKEIELKKKEYEDAKKVLRLVFKLISEKYGADDVSSRKLYSRPILEAACQDAYDIVDGILEKWPEAIICKDEKGHNIIQLATMHRSLKIYNLIYTFKEHSNDDYGTMEDSSENNMLHLAGRLAPLNKLKRHTGAALQLQSELQWHQEVRNIMFPSYVTKKNIFGETPEMVFTREHENLVNEGEKWIKAVAESCSITAALITTIVFAAAITVPGGSSQAGVPVFTNEIAFAVLALSDAISLFTSVTALLVFLSILTSRFSEQDFLDHLPGRLFIGLCTLLVSTTAMMVAFSATLFLVFCHQKFWVIAPICGLAILPIAFFIVLQFPLVLDLFRSTCISRFGKLNLHNSKLNPTDLKFFFADKDEGSHHEQEKKKPKKSNKGGGMSFKRSETHKAKRPPNSHEPTATSI